MADNKDNYFKIQGVVFKIFPTNQVSDKFKKREFVIELTKEHNGKTYTELVTFTALQDRADSIDYLSVGSEVEVSFALSGREWAPATEPENKKYFNTLTALHVQNNTRGVQDPVQTAPSVAQGVEDDFDDTSLPF